ncbi:MAG: hypothetical protein Q9M48_04595 [Rhodobacterales bacterium]|nr:hypothetical protein [Rhodobacterales bacterium]
MKHFWACAFLGCLLGASAQAQTTFGALTDRERVAFGQELRAALRASPEIVAGVSDRQSLIPPPAPSPVAQAYAQAVADDLALIGAHSARLFDPEQMAFGRKNGVPVALFITRDCADCQRAQTDLRALANTVEMRVTLFDLTTESDMADALGIDSAPSYVLPNMMIRGQMPNIVMSRYLTALMQANQTQTGPAQPADPAK